jgi:hypothetical protein
MNRTIKDATVKRFYYDSHDQLRRHLADFVSAYNFARQPHRFTVNPLQQMPGLNI